MIIDQQVLDARQVFTLEIAGKKFEKWSEVELEQSLDGFSTVGFTAPFNPQAFELPKDSGQAEQLKAEADARERREVFRPFSFAPVKLYEGDELVFTGQMVNVEPRFDKDGGSVCVRCASLPCVLADCSVPNELKGREFNGLDLLSLSRDLCAPFGFTTKFADARAQTAAASDLAYLTTANRPDLVKKAKEALAARFPRVKIGRDEKIFNFLCTLAKQRGVIMTDDALGDLVFGVSAPTGNPVVHLEEGRPPLLSVKAQFNERECYSEVTVFVAKKRGKKPSSFTLKNQLLKNVLRPASFTCESEETGNAPAAAAAFMGRMFGSIASYEVDLPTHIDPQGRFYKPNTTMTLSAPSAMVYGGKYEFLIRSVTKRQDKNSSTCTLGLVLPGAFSGEAPAVLPWAEPSGKAS